MKITTKTGTCSKCDGRGYINGFSHIANGRCFLCTGSGTMTIKIREYAQGRDTRTAEQLAATSRDTLRRIYKAIKEGRVAREEGEEEIAIHLRNYPEARAAFVAIGWVQEAA